MCNEIPNDVSSDPDTDADDRRVNNPSSNGRSERTNDADDTHFCSGVSDCKKCRQKYDHDAIFSRKTNTHGNLMNFFRGLDRKKVKFMLPEKTNIEETPSLVLPNNKRVRLSSSIVAFSSRCYNLSIWRRILVILVVSVVAGFVSAIFLQNTGLYMSGLAGTSQGIARLVRACLDPKYAWVYNVLFWILIIIVNIPFAVFGYYKISRDFAIMTLIYVSASNLFGFAISNIPGIKTFVLVGPRPDPNQTILIWNKANGGALLGILLAGLVYSQIGATLYTVLFSLECSSGGFDFVSVWYSRRKHKSIAKAFTIINCFSMYFGTILGGYIAQCKDNHCWGELNNYMFTPNFLCSLIMVIFQGISLNLLFPRFKWARVDIYGNKTNEIRNILISDHHQHSLSIYKIIGGYSLKERQMITLTCLYFEIPRLMSLIRYVDKNGLIVISEVKNLDGYVYIYAKPSQSSSTRRKKVVEQPTKSPS